MRYLQYTVWYQSEDEYKMGNTKGNIWRYDSKNQLCLKTAIEELIRYFKEEPSLFYNYYQVKGFALAPHIRMFHPENAAFPLADTLV